MRDLAWRYFETTGEIDAYMLYKEHQKICGDGVTETACALENTEDGADE